MTVMHIQSKTDREGKLQIAVGVPEADVDLVVVVKQDLQENPQTDEAWANAVLSLQGSIKDPSFRRYPQGEFPIREPLR
ncbi:MAG: hypothetical protein FWD53_00555 [Phycisphaerales bacterium]|nr:hypothetical protein [Phycisphaerales bacterium]